MSNIEVIEGFEKENYGAYTLKKVYPKNLSIGLIIGVFLHVAGIVSYYVSTVVSNDDKVITIKFTDVNELQNAPPLQDVTPPPAVKIEVQEVVKPTSGTPIVVPDEEAAQEQTIQTQEEIKTDIAAPTNLGSTEGEIKVDISGTIESLTDNNEPGMDEFVAVEQYPVPLARPNVVYPDIAKKAGIEGKVLVKALIDESGNVTKVAIISGEEIFRDAAVTALQQVKFKPAINGNRAVKVWITYPVIFRLK